MVLDTIADLTATTTLDINEIYLVAGYHAVNDGGGGSFVWRLGTRPPEDNGIVFWHSDSGITYGWFERIVDVSPINILWYGAQDGQDSTDAIRKAINGNDDVYIPEGIFQYSSSSCIQLRSNLRISGKGTIAVMSTLGHSDEYALFNNKGVKIINVELEGITIDGGGKNVTPVHGTKGFFITSCERLSLKNLLIKNCGVVNQLNIKNDAGYGGYGIYVGCNHGPVENVKIENCTVINIAGGGFHAGDGICISGENQDLSLVPKDVLITGCTVDTVGRMGITCGGEPYNGASPSANIRITNNNISNTQLSGIDLEEASNVLISNNRFSGCGTCSEYFDSVEEYGEGYRLLAGIASGVESENVVISGAIMDNCYIGISFGPLFHEVSDVIISDSVYSDIRRGLFNSGQLMLNNCKFNSELNTLSYLSDAENNSVFSNCSFSGKVVLEKMVQGTFQGCEFKRGIRFGTDTSRITFNACLFTGTSTTVAIDCAHQINLFVRDCIVAQCRFKNVGAGISAAYRSVYGWRVIGNVFSSCTDAIVHSNAAGEGAFQTISSNQFLNCEAGIKINQSNPGLIIADNSFISTINCIDLYNIISGTDLYDVVIRNNVASSGTNGIKVGLVAPAVWDRCIVAENNMNGASGTKYSLPGGNAGGFIVNNI